MEQDHDQRLHVDAPAGSGLTAASGAAARPMMTFGGGGFLPRHDALAVGPRQGRRVLRSLAWPAVRTQTCLRRLVPAPDGWPLLLAIPTLSRHAGDADA